MHLIVKITKNHLFYLKKLFDIYCYYWLFCVVYSMSTKYRLTAFGRGSWSTPGFNLRPKAL